MWVTLSRLRIDRSILKDVRTLYLSKEKKPLFAVLGLIAHVIINVLSKIAGMAFAKRGPLYIRIVTWLHSLNVGDFRAHSTQRTFARRHFANTMGNASRKHAISQRTIHRITAINIRCLSIASVIILENIPFLEALRDKLLIQQVPITDALVSLAILTCIVIQVSARTRYAAKKHSTLMLLTSWKIVSFALEALALKMVNVLLESVTIAHAYRSFLFVIQPLLFCLIE